MCWNFFASNHGYGKVDDVGALLKQENRKEQIKPHVVRLQHTHNVVIFYWQRACMVAQLYYLHLG